MANINKLKDKIKSTIYPNGKGAINASDHQAMLLDMADGMAETDTKLAELSEELGQYETGGEYIRAYTDADGRFLWGIKHDGSIEYAKGVPAPIKEYIVNLNLVKQNEVAYLKTLEETFSFHGNPEFIKVVTDSEGKVLWGIKSDGSVEFAKGVPTPIKRYIKNMNTIPLSDYNDIVKGINHRGWHQAPENTLVAFRESKKNGFFYVEADVSFTKDKVAVLLHDDTIDRTSNGTGKVDSFTYQELLNYDFGNYKGEQFEGTKIPTLEEFLSLCRNLGLHAYIEIKETSDPESNIVSIVNMVNSCGMRGKVSFISFSSYYLNIIKENDSRARLGFLCHDLDANVVQMAAGLRTEYNEVFVDAADTDENRNNVQLCIAESIPLELWTTNTLESILDAPTYVSGFTSDSLVAGKVLYENNIK